MENIKLFTLVKTQLHNDTEIWHFATLKAAQDEMIGLCNEIVGENICALDTSAKNKYWDFTSGTYYATLSNGNTIEFEIFEKEIDMYYVMVNHIADRVCEMYSACKPYRDLIYKHLLSFNSDELSFSTIADIDHFIDNDFKKYLAEVVAEVLMPCNDNSDFHYVCSDYLVGSRGLSVMLGIINNEKDAIDDVKEDINKTTNLPIFKTDFVWVFESYWDDGMNFSRKIQIKIFKDFNNARKAMMDEYKNIISNVLPKFYDIDDVCHTETEDTCKVYDNHVNDMWVGKIFKKYIED